MIVLQRVASLCVFGMCMLCTNLAWSQVMRVGGSNQSANFIEAPRYIEQELRDAERAIEQEQFSDAVVRLGNLLQREMNEARDADLAGQDFFLIDPTNRNSVRQDQSFLRRARKLLGDLPTAALDTYELQFGALARRMLDEASERRDWDQLRAVRRKYFHTQAGYEASLILAQHALMEGHPLSASLLLDAIVDCPRAVNHLGPSVRLMHAMAAHISGRDISEFDLSGSGKVQVAGKSLDWPKPDDAMVWLEDTFDIVESRDVLETESYAFQGATPNRNGTSAGQMPLSTPEWMVPTTATDSQTQLVNEMQRDMTAGGKLPPPSLSPLRVGDLLLVRTTDLLYGVDYKTGKRIWSYPWQATNDEATDNNVSASPTISPEDKGPKDILMQRVWNDLPYGQLSSDGERAFLIYDLSPIEYVPTNPSLFGRATKSADTKGNTLAAFDLASEGKMKWQQGRSGDPASVLADAFFLGPPLPLDGRLYAMVEMSGDISIVCLDAKSGEEEWRQQLVAVETSSVNNDAFRRIAGATPTYHEGLLICPTGAGATVAIDLADRMLRWGIRYSRKTVTNYYTRSRTKREPSYYLDRWHSGTAIASDSSVFVTPIESDRLYCFDLLTGDNRFPSKSRSQMRYLAGVRDGNFITVGPRDVRAYSVETGAESWRTKNILSSGQQIVGRGVFGKDGFYLPTSGNVLIKIALDDGRELDRRETQFPLGNLIACNGDVISQSPTKLTLAYGEQDLEPRVDDALAKNPDDTDSLILKAQLLMQRGLRQDALDILVRADQLRPDDLEIQLLSIDVMLAIIRDTGTADADLIRRLDETIDTPEKRAEFLGLRIKDSIKKGEIESAIDQLVALSELASTEKNLALPGSKIVNDNAREFSLDAWITARIDEVWNLSDEDQKLALTNRFEKIQEEKREQGTSVLIQLVKHFEALDSAVLFSELADRLVKEGRFAELEQISVGARAPQESGNLSVSKQIARAKAQIGMRRGNDALETLSSVPLNEELDGETNKTLAELRRAAQQRVPEAVQWDKNVSVELQTQQSRLSVNLSVGQEVFPIQWQYGRDFRGWRLSGDDNGNSLALMDNFGVPHAIAPDEANGSSSTSSPEAIISGNVMLKITPGVVAAYDLSNIASNQSNRALLWKKDFGSDGASIAKRTSDTVSLGTNIHWYPINAATARVAAAEFRVGPILGDRVIILLGGDLIAMSLQSGEILWRNNSAPRRGHIISAGSKVAVVSDSTKTLEIFNVYDGSKLESRGWDFGKVWHTRGSHVLTDSPDEGRRNTMLRIINPFDDRVVLEHQSTTGNRIIQDGAWTFGRIVSNQYMVLLSSDGRLLIWDILSGKPLSDIETTPIELNRLHAMEINGQIVVLPWSKESKKDPDGRMLQTREGNPHQTCHVAYAVSTETGELTWELDFEGVPWGCTLHQPVDSPVLLFSRLWTEYPKKKTTRIMTMDVRAIDVSSGEVLLDKTGIAMPSRNNKLATRVTCQPVRKRVIARVSNQILTYEFGEQP